MNGKKINLLSKRRKNKQTSFKAEIPVFVCPGKLGRKTNIPHCLGKKQLPFNSKENFEKIHFLEKKKSHTTGNKIK